MNTAEYTRKLLAAFACAVAFFTFGSSTSWAMNASPHPFEEFQPDGTSIKLFVRGNENFHWLEDEDGYTVVKDKPTRRFMYAQRAADGKLKPTAFQVGRDNPRRKGLKRRSLPSLEQIRSRDYRNNTSPLAAEGPAAIDGPEGGAPEGGVGPAGTVQNLVILIRFSDHVSGPKYRPVPPPEDYETLFNAVGGDPNIAPSGSVKDVYFENSYGQITLQSTVVGWVDLPQTEAYYANGNSGLTSLTWYAIIDALDIVNDNVDFGQFDNDNDGYIDSIAFVHSGYGAEWGGTDQFGSAYTDRMWSHRWSIPTWSSGDFNFNGQAVKVSAYHINPGLWSTSGSNIGRIGVIAHETGHFFGLPDLYDTDSGAGEGIGSYGLMANSWGFDGSQLYPPHFSPWSKINLGWLTPTIINTEGVYSIDQSETSPQVYRIDEGYPPGEYLLIENRQPVGFDRKMPQGGLAMFHIDDNAGYNTQGYPGQSGWPDNGNHYRVALLQADGNYDLEHGNNRGDGGDVYPNCTSYYLASDTTPNNNAYQGGNIVVNDKAIYGISTPGTSMSFSYGAKPLEAARTTLFLDDFESDLGWTKDPNGSDTATTGIWERADPQPTGIQLGDTVSGSFDLVTQAAAGSGDGSYDIDNGTTSILSPAIGIGPDLTDIRLSFWFYLSQSSSSTDDFLRLTVVGSNGSQVIINRTGVFSPGTPAWSSCSVDISVFSGDTINVLIEAADGGAGHFVEAGIDDVQISAVSTGGTGGTPPGITGHPSAVTVTEGNAAQFSVVASGDPPVSYQWRRGGTSIPGANGASYTLNPAALSDNGAEFDVVVSNTLGSVASNAALLTVTPQPVPPAITSTPRTAAVVGVPYLYDAVNNDNTIEATGSPPPTFNRSSGPADFQVLLNGTVSWTPSVPGSYPVTITASNGALPNDSQSFTVDVSPAPTPPQITTQPASVTVTEGNAAQFSVVASGTGVLGYQWRRGGAPIPGANGASYTLNPAALSDNGAEFDVVVSNTLGSVASNAALLTVTPQPVPPAITSTPRTAAVVGVPYLYDAVNNDNTIEATGSPPPTFNRSSGPTDFQVLLNGTVSWTPSVPGSYPVTITASNGALPNDAQTFTVTVNTSGGGTPIDAWTAVGQNPTGAWSDRNDGDNRSYRVLLKGGSIDSTGSTVQLTLRGRRSGSYTVQRVSLVRRDGNTLNGVDSTFREVTFGDTWNAGVVVAPGTMVTSDPIAFDLVAGEDVFLTYWMPKSSRPTQRNGGSNTSAWMKKSTDYTSAVDWGGLPISDTNQYIYAAEKIEVVATGGGGAAPQITTQPASVTVVEGGSATFIVLASGSGVLSYQWRRDGLNIPGATGSSFTLNPAALSDNGADFDVVVSNNIGSVASDKAVLTVNTSGGGTPIDAWTAVGQNPTGAWSDRNDGDNRSYRVLLKGGSIDSTGSTVQLTLRGRRSGSYTVQRVSLVRRDGNTLNGVDSTFREVTFGDTWNAGVVVAPGTMVTSDPIAFDLVAGEDVFLTYWMPKSSRPTQRNGGSNTSAWMKKSTDYTSAVDWGGLPISDTNQYIYAAEKIEVVATGGGGAAPQITTQPASVTVVEGGSATFIVLASGSGVLSYQWRRDGLNIPGATGSSFTLNPAALSDNGADFDVVVSNNIGSVASDKAVLTVNTSGGGTPIDAWTAVGQNPTGAWSDRNDGDNRSYRVLLKGGSIDSTGSTVQLTLRGRRSGSYTVQRVSLVRRDGNTLNGVDSTFREVTFGDTWNAGVVVAPGTMVTSDPIAFDLVAGEDVFLTYWMPKSSRPTQRNGGSNTSAWMKKSTDYTSAVDWGGLPISDTNQYIYAAEKIEMLQ